VRRTIDALLIGEISCRNVERVSCGWVVRHAYSQTRLGVASGKAEDSVFFKPAVPPSRKKFNVTLELLEKVLRFA
jgi:hypothetical protein